MRRQKKFEKNLPPDLTKQLFLLSSVKTSGRFFEIYVTFSEKLNFTYFRFYASHPDTWMHLDQGPQTVYSAYAQWVVSWGLFFRLFGHMEPYDFCPILFYSPSRLM